MYEKMLYLYYLRKAILLILAHRANFFSPSPRDALTLCTFMSTKLNSDLLQFWICQPSVVHCKDIRVNIIMFKIQQEQCECRHRIIVRVSLLF